MKKIVRLTESDLVKLVKRVIKEQQAQTPETNIKSVPYDILKKYSLVEVGDKTKREIFLTDEKSGGGNVFFTYLGSKTPDGKISQYFTKLGLKIPKEMLKEKLGGDYKFVETNIYPEGQYGTIYVSTLGKTLV